MKFPVLIRRHIFWLNLPSTILITLLQRTPVLRMVCVAEEMVVSSPLGAMLRSAFVGSVALGGMVTIAGATTIDPSTPGPLIATVGTPVSVGFSLNGVPGPASGEWNVSGIPPGLDVTGGTASVLLFGTPTTAGTFHLLMTAPWTDNSVSIDYEIRVSAGNIAPAITTQPTASQTVNAGATATFTIAASGTPAPTYQWQVSTNGGSTWGNLSNAPPNSGVTTVTLSVTTNAGLNGNKYRCVATNSAGSATSNAATLAVNFAPGISTQPAVSVTVNDGDPASFTIAATGNPAPTYQWQVSTNGGGAWNDLSNSPPYSGVTTVTLSVTTNTGMDGYKYRCVATNSVGSATSNASTLTVNVPSVAPGISTQPAASVTVNDGDPASFTIAATGTPAPTYQWQVSTNGGGAWNDLSDSAPYSGVTAVTLMVTTNIGLNGYMYRCVATNIGGSATSNAATLTVNSASVAPNISVQPAASQTVTVGDAVSLTVTASGTPAPTYQWRKGGTPIDGATSATLAFASVHGTDAGTYDVVVTNSAGFVTSDPATLAVNRLTQTITFVLPDVAFTATPITLTATASSGLPVTYSVFSGPATVSGDQLTLTGIGLVTVLATQFGNSDYEPIDLDRTFNVNGNYETWRQSQFTVGELADSNISGPNVVYGHDGLTNLVKYALGLTAKVDTISGLPMAGVLATDWVYDYWRPSSITDVTYEVEVSSNLSGWTTTGVTLEHVNTIGGSQLWRAKYPLTSASTVYFRLKITHPAN